MGKVIILAARLYEAHDDTESNFAAAHLIDTAFAPRLKKVGKQTLSSFSSRGTHQRRGDVILPGNKLNQKLILSPWDDILRFMATNKLRHSSDSLLFKRLSSYARDHPLYKALKGFGRIIKARFILTYFDDLELCQRIEKQLNKIELANRFSKAVFFANNQEIPDNSLEEQENAITSDSLLTWQHVNLQGEYDFRKVAANDDIA